MLLTLVIKYPHLKFILDSYVEVFDISLDALWDLNHGGFRTALGADFEKLVKDVTFESGLESAGLAIDFAPTRIYTEPLPDPDYRIFPTPLQTRPESLLRKTLTLWVSFAFLPDKDQL